MRGSRERNLSRLRPHSQGPAPRVQRLRASRAVFGRRAVGACPCAARRAEHPRPPEDPGDALLAPAPAARSHPRQIRQPASRRAPHRRRPGGGDRRASLGVGGGDLRSAAKEDRPRPEDRLRPHRSHRPARNRRRCARRGWRQIGVERCALGRLRGWKERKGKWVGRPGARRRPRNALRSLSMGSFRVRSSTTGLSGLCRGARCAQDGSLSRGSSSVGSSSRPSRSSAGAPASARPMAGGGGLPGEAACLWERVVGRGPEGPHEEDRCRRGVWPHRCSGLEPPRTGSSGRQSSTGLSGQSTSPRSPIGTPESNPKSRLSDFSGSTCAGSPLRGPGIRPEGIEVHLRLGVPDEREAGPAPLWRRGAGWMRGRDLRGQWAWDSAGG